MDEATRAKLADYRLTNLKRLIADRKVRQRLGIDVVKGAVVTRLDDSEVLKGLTRVVRDVAEGLKVTDIYSATDRKHYLGGFERSQLPNVAKASGTARPLVSDAEEGGNGSSKSTTTTTRRGPSRAPRATVAPTSCRLTIPNARIKSIFRELQMLRVDETTNACAVLMRVFLELNVDHHIEANGLLKGRDFEKATLGKKLSVTATDLKAKGRLTPQEVRPLEAAAHDKRTLFTNVVTFHQYVHNPYFTPTPSDLRAAWDNLQTFFERIWG